RRLKCEMRISRRYQDAVRHHGHAVLGDASLATSDAAKLAREHAHERDRQMLGDEDRNADLRRQRVEQRTQRVNATCRSPDRQYVDRIGWHCSKERLYAAFRRNRRRWIDGRVAERLQLAEQDLGELTIEPARARLGHGIVSAKRQRSDGL